MKRIIFFFSLMCLLIFIYNENIDLKNVKTTDLSNVDCDGMHVRDNFEYINSFTLSNEFQKKKNIIYYEECYVMIDDNNIIKLIHANFKDVNISINFINNFKTIDEIVKTLGTSYDIRWYDREQQLKQLIYVDRENYIKARFIYNTYNNQLVWLIIESTK